MTAVPHRVHRYAGRPRKLPGRRNSSVDKFFFVSAAYDDTGRNQAGISISGSSPQCPNAVNARRKALGMAARREPHKNDGCRLDLHGALTLVAARVHQREGRFDDAQYRYIGRRADLKSADISAAVSTPPIWAMILASPPAFSLAIIAQLRS